MKLTSILLGLIVGLTFFILLPFIFMNINLWFKLPEYSFLELKVLGLFFILVGIMLFIYCSGQFFLLGKGTPAPIEPPKKLVINGLYKYTRNPIYIGYFMILLGEFLFFGQFLLLIFFFLAIIGINIYVIFHEEPILKKRFGKSYEDYLKKIPRWL